MQRVPEGGPESFPELYEVIRDYAGRDGTGSYDYHEMALSSVAAAYAFRFEVPPMRDPRELVDRLLDRYGYYFPTKGRGSLHPASVEAVVAAALRPGDPVYALWGTDRLAKMLEAVARRLREEESYAFHGEEARLIGDGIARIEDFFRSLPALEAPPPE